MGNADTRLELNLKRNCHGIQNAKYLNK